MTPLSILRNMQLQQRDFRGTVPAPRLLARNAAGHVQNRGRGVKDSAVVFHSGGAWREDRPNGRNADLSAVRVPAEHKIGVVGPGPIKLVRAVREDDSQLAAVGGARAGQLPRSAAGAKPRQLVARQNDRLAADVDLQPAAAQIDQAALGNGFSELDFIDAQVVIA